MVYNSDWLGTMTFADVLKLSSNYTVSQMLERDDFHKRFESLTPISLVEFLYPLAQAMDSVVVKSDVELGGTDQKFNLLVARDIQRAYGVPPQAIITTPILVGTDGHEKMSKSLDNYIALNDFPNDMYGKLLSSPDELMGLYYQYVLFYSAADAAEVTRQIESGELHPRDAKRRLAREVVARYTSEGTAAKAEEEFDRIFIRKDVPEQIDSFKVESPVAITDLLVSAGMAASKGEARRLIQGGGVSIDGERVEDANLVYNASGEQVLKVGKRQFLRLDGGG
jgi:tyrosyl-tRNA synthetase